MLLFNSHHAGVENDYREYSSECQNDAETGAQILLLRFTFRDYIGWFLVYQDPLTSEHPKMCTFTTNHGQKIPNTLDWCLGTWFVVVYARPDRDLDYYETFFKLLIKKHTELTKLDTKSGFTTKFVHGGDFNTRLGAKTRDCGTDGKPVVHKHAPKFLDFVRKYDFYCQYLLCYFSWHLHWDE